MTQPRNVVSVASHGGEYFYYVIEAVVLLNHDEPVDTTITFLPFEPPFAASFKRIRSPLRPTAGMSPLERKHRATEDAVFAQVQQGRTVQIERAGYTITIQRRRLSRPRALLTWLAAGGRALKLWVSCFAGRRFQPMRFLRTRYQGVQIGDLAASTFFRTNLSADEPRPVPLLFFMLWWACYLIDSTRELIDTNAGGAFTITPEPNYIHSAPYRYLRQRGYTGLDIYQPNTPLLKRERSDDISLPRHFAGVAADAGHVLPPGSEDQVAAYFRARLHTPARMLWYMSHGHNDNRASELSDFRGRPITLAPEGLYAVIFLHSFADGQYFFGVDGFQSLGDWTYHTIEACLANSTFRQVLIKPHPNANYDVHPGDRRALDRIMRRYAGRDRIVVLSPSTSIVGLCAATRMFGLTHHGSIAEELVYLGQPVIASTFAWWSDRYRFARLWSEPGEYDALVAGLSEQDWQPPTATERHELYRYLIDFRFREVPCDRTFPAFILARLRNPALAGAPVRLRIDEETSYSRELEALRADDPVFAQLLSEFEKLATETPALWPVTRVG